MSTPKPRTITVLDRYQITGRGEALCVRNPDPSYLIGEYVRIEGEGSALYEIYAKERMGFDRPGSTCGLLVRLVKEA